MPRLPVAAEEPSVLRQHVTSDRRRIQGGRRCTDRLSIAEAGVSVGPFTLDERRKTVYMAGEELYLSPKLYDLLRIFLLNPGKVMSGAQVAADLWPSKHHCDSDSVKQYVYLLRKSIESDPNKPYWLRNVRGFGYQLFIGER